MNIFYINKEEKINLYQKKKQKMKKKKLKKMKNIVDKVYE